MRSLYCIRSRMSKTL